MYISTHYWVCMCSVYMGTFIFELINQYAQLFASVSFWFIITTVQFFHPWGSHIMSDEMHRGGIELFLDAGPRI